MEKYKENATQKARLLEVLQTGKAVTQINLTRYLALLAGQLYEDDGVVDALADLGIANLPARVFGLKEDGYLIKATDVKVQGRFCETHYAVYTLLEEPTKEKEPIIDNIQEDGQVGLFQIEKPWYCKGDN